MEQTQPLASYIDEIQRLWPTETQEPTDQALALAQRALVEFPDSAQLHLRYGELLSMKREPDAAAILEQYLTAVLIAPDLAETYEDIGFFFDVYGDRFQAAERAFRRAVSLDPERVDSWVGLLRSLAQQGRKDELRALLASQPDLQRREAVKALVADIKGGLWDPI